MWYKQIERSSQSTLCQLTILADNYHRPTWDMKLCKDLRPINSRYDGCEKSLEPSRPEQGSWCWKTFRIIRKTDWASWQEFMEKPCKTINRRKSLIGTLSMLLVPRPVIFSPGCRVTQIIITANTVLTCIDTDLNATQQQKTWKHFFIVWNVTLNSSQPLVFNS